MLTRQIQPLRNIRLRLSNKRKLGVEHTLFLEFTDVAGWYSSGIVLSKGSQKMVSRSCSASGSRTSLWLMTLRAHEAMHAPAFDHLHQKEGLLHPL